MLQVLSATVQNSVARVHRHAEFVHLWFALFSDVTIKCMCSWKKKLQLLLMGEEKCEMEQSQFTVRNSLQHIHAGTGKN